MSNNTESAIAAGIGLGICALVGVSFYQRHKKRQAEKQMMKDVRHKVANLIKDVPGYSKPSR